jgi:hypothetical protein
MQGTRQDIAVDLAMRSDPGSALAGVSAADGNP